MAIDRDPLHLFPAFRAKVEIILAETDAFCKKHYPELKPYLFEGFRTTKRQKELYAQGRTTGVKGKTVTQRNGTTNPSDHQSSLACDIVFKRSGSWTWTIPAEVWDYLAHCARAQGLTAGDDWKSPDSPHIQWNESDKAVYEAARAWKKAQGLV